MISLKIKKYPSIILTCSFSAIFFLTGCNNIRPNTATQVTNNNIIHSQEMNDTLRLLEELNVKLEYGLNKTDYIENLASIKISFNRINNESEKQVLEKVISTYDLAYDFWNECGSVRYEYNCTGHQVQQIISPHYPEIFLHEDDPSYTSNKGTARSGLSLLWNTDIVLSYLWNIASVETEKINSR